MKNTLKLLSLCVLLSVAAVGIFVFSSGSSFGTGEKAPSSSSSPVTPLPPVEPVSVAPVVPEPTTIRLVAAGDNLIHDNIYKQANARTGGKGYDFAPVYERVLPLIAGADVAVINQETPLAAAKFELSGYPRFNSPDEVGNQLVKMGFNVVTCANNHMFDMGEEGLKATMDFWDKNPDVLHMGAWRNEAAMQKPLIREEKGIKLGFVPVTEHTNGLKLPAKTELRFIRSDETELMKQQVDLARANSDFVVIVIHWGTEDSTKTNDNQKHLAQTFADWGVDLVIGHHSHTLQPMEWVTGKDGNKMLMTYSLGNFVSSMLYPQHMMGGVLDIDITKNHETNKTTITRAALKPTITQYDGAGRREVRIYPFEEYTDELAGKHGIRANYDYFGIPFFAKIIKENIPEEFRPQLPL